MESNTSPSLLAKIWKRARQAGLVGLARRALDEIRWRWFESRLGVKTKASIEGAALGHSDQEYGYQPIDHRSFEIAMRSLDISDDDVFIDIGCGMGRAVLLAARHPFRRVLGVEYAENLYDIARNNVAGAAASLPCSDVAVIHADATQFELPADVTVVFMFNPFGGDVLDRVMSNIERSFLQRPRNLRIIYSIPRGNDDPLARLDWISQATEIRTPHAEWEQMTLYEAAPQHAAQL
ncbi:MAG: class I SAM-dependent methyltransferase [Pirellulaceae bacterium]|nr:class I SAM-dependent methyltransferase [Pirellulaceae bacterium]